MPVSSAQGLRDLRSASDVIKEEWTRPHGPTWYPGKSHAIDAKDLISQVPTRCCLMATQTIAQIACGDANEFRPVPLDYIASRQ